MASEMTSNLIPLFRLRKTKKKLMGVVKEGETLIHTRLERVDVLYAQAYAYPLALSGTDWHRVATATEIKALILAIAQISCTF
jgi:ABC-type phosphate/phosphonate transport system ATPase subunit